MSPGKLKRWLFLPADQVTLQVPRALAASVLCAILDCGCMVLLVELCNWQPVWAAVLGYLIGGVLQYALCLIWVFPSVPGNKTVGFVPFTVLSLGGLGITWAIMDLGAGFFFPYGLSRFLALGFTFVWNFTSRKFLLFSPREISFSATTLP